MRVCVIGAGALGGTFAARLAVAGHTVTLIDTWPEHVAAIRAEGLRVDGVPGELCVRLRAQLDAAGIDGQDLALVATDANHTVAAAATAARVLATDGVALSVQNGIGNIEAISAAVDQTRVIGGSTMASFRLDAPGRVTQTHEGPTTIGELDGRETPRLEALRSALESAGLETRTSPDIMAVIWDKFLLNLAINPLCAATFLRLGEVARCDATDRYQDRLIEEAFSVTRAKGLRLDLDAIRHKIKAHTWAKFSKPSMLQHLERGRRTEIDALNGALVREAQALGIAAPFNEALTLLIQGCEAYHRRRVSGVALDEAALEAEAARAPRPPA
jgi:2-dehydropantoate 2-reductase